jgi:hypothetical protein
MRLLSEAVFSRIKSWDDIRTLLKNNSDMLEYLGDFAGFDKFLGNGENGKVWKIRGKSLTLKITKDVREIRIANRLLGKKLKSFVNVYNATDVMYGNKPVQIRIQEMCNPFDKAEWVEFGPVLSDLSDFLGEGSLSSIDDFIGKLKEQTEAEIADYMSDRDKRSAERVKANYAKSVELIRNPKFKRWFDFYISLSKEVSKIGSTFDKLDLHDENIMEDKNGRLKMIDF